MAKRQNSFKLLGQAIKDSRKPMWASIQVLIVLTVILATIFFIAEYSVQPEEYNYGKSLLWAFTRYIGDPGKFSGPGPITFTGRFVASLIGIVGILIFAVPAGLISSGFRGAIDKELRKKHLDDIGERLKKAFRRKQDGKTMYMCVPRNIPLGQLQAQKHMSEKDVIDAVDYNPPFRLRYIIPTETGTYALEQLVVEMFPKNTSYGACIDRNSKITIVCPSAVNEPAIGNFTYYLALIGGFNYISKEIDPTPDEPSSYYILPKDNKTTQFAQYLDDLKRLSDGEDHWTIFFVTSESKKETDVHFITKANSKTERESTILDAEGFNRLYEEASKQLRDQFDILSDIDEYKPVGPRNISVMIGGGLTTNTFSIRIYSELMIWDKRYIAIAKCMAEAINVTIGDPEKVTPTELLKQRGLEYQI